MSPRRRVGKVSAARLGQAENQEDYSEKWPGRLERTAHVATRSQQYLAMASKLLGGSNSSEMPGGKVGGGTGGEEEQPCSSEGRASGGGKLKILAPPVRVMARARDALRIISQSSGRSKHGSHAARSRHHPSAATGASRPGAGAGWAPGRPKARRLAGSGGGAAGGAASRTQGVRPGELVQGLPGA